jgi:cation diffusion facilitator CzcD-associated flavoprotein CzcO
VPRSFVTELANEHLDVLIVGAGLSGIDAAYRLQTGSPGHSYAIFEARDAIGGTWDLFRYPGVRSDSDMTTLGFPFRPWRKEQAIVDGAEIRDYIDETAAVFGIDRHIRFGHRVIESHWSSGDACWTVTFESAAVRQTLTCAFLYFCSGYYDYRQGYAPVWPGMDAFRGRIIHPQFWPENLDVDGKSVAVIGSGATAVTLIPALVKLGAAHVAMVQRSPSYIVSTPATDAIGIKLRQWLPAGVADRAVRWKNIHLGNFFYLMSRHFPGKVKSLISAPQREALGPDFDMRHLTPNYDPWDERLCVIPDGDLFAVIRSKQVEMITDTIERFTHDRLRLASGRELAADIIVTATGLTVQMLGGASVHVDGVKIDPATRLLYKGAMVDGVPNFAFAVGYSNATWTLKCDLTAQFVSRLLNHMRRRGLAVVRPEAPPDCSTDEPILGLKSGYVLRAAKILPRQGRVAPWQAPQNYFRDFFAFRLSRIGGRELKFEKECGAPKPNVTL